MAHAAKPAKPNGTGRTPNLHDPTTQAHTSAERNRSETQQPTVGFAEKATEAHKTHSQPIT